jgi:hypothetical protein
MFRAKKKHVHIGILLLTTTVVAGDSNLPLHINDSINQSGA